MKSIQSSSAASPQRVLHQHSHIIHDRSRGLMLEVYDADFRSLFKVPVALVGQMPANHADIPRLVLCKHQAEAGPDSCPLGRACKFVHVRCPLAALSPPDGVHVCFQHHYQADAMYPRLPPGYMLTVAAPNNRLPVERLPSDCILATRGAVNRHVHHAQLSHCAHFTFNKLCKRGADCHFIHLVAVDAASVPAGHVARAFSTRVTKLFAITTPPGAASATFTPVPDITVSESESGGMQRADAPMPRLDAALLQARPSDPKSPIGSLRSDTGMSSLDSSSSTPDNIAAAEHEQHHGGAARLYRHNPYSARTCRVWL